MKGFLDRVVGRATGLGAFLQPRLAHRYAPPQHDVVPAAGDARGARAGRDEDGAATNAEDQTASGGDELAGRAPRPASPPLRAVVTGRPGIGDAAAGSGVRVEAERLVPTEMVDVAGGPPPVMGGRMDSVGAPAQGPATSPTHVAAAIEAGPSSVDASAPPPTPSTRISVGARARANRALGAGWSADGGTVLAQRSTGDPLAAAAGRAVPAPPPSDGSASLAASSVVKGEDAFWRFLYPPSVDATTARDPTGVDCRPRGGGPPDETVAPAIALSSHRGLGAATAMAPATANPAASPRTMMVSIGRIDVRGSAPPPRPVAPTRRAPRLGLADYMRLSGPGSSRR